MLLKSDAYPASLKVDYPQKLDRMSTFFRALFIIPVFIILTLLSGAGIGGYTSSESWNSAATQDSEATTGDSRGGIGR